MQPFAPLFPLGQVLHQQARGLYTRSVGTHGAANKRGHLFGLIEIALASFGQAVTFERNNSLIASLAAGKIESDGEIALAEQCEERRIGAQFG